MKESPILFNGDMVRAILAGQKTQTRRIIKGRPSKTQQDALFCPYGHPSDRLWVKETFAYAQDGTVVYRASMVGSPWDAITRRAITWRPSIHMPRWASRITLEITDVRVERVQDISEADAWAEGIEVLDGQFADADICATAKKYGLMFENANCIYAHLWDTLYAARGLGWGVNPWVWVITFKRAEEVCPE